MKFPMFMVNKSIYNLPFKVSMHKENEEVVGFVKVIGNGGLITLEAFDVSMGFVILLL
jgi:hypothetical protein